MDFLTRPSIIKSQINRVDTSASGLGDIRLSGIAEVELAYSISTTKPKIYHFIKLANLLN